MRMIRKLLMTTTLLLCLACTLALSSSLSGTTASVYRYRVAEYIVVTNQKSDSESSRGSVFAAWKHRYPSRSQFRKACRQGHLLLLTRPDTGKSTEKDKNSFVHNVTERCNNETDDIHHVLTNLDDASRQLLAPWHPHWFRPWTPLPPTLTDEEEIHLARIVRITSASSPASSSACSSVGYPQTVTGWVTPPPVVTSGRFTDVLYQDDHVAVVDKPEGLVTIGTPRNDLQSAVPFVVQPPPISLWPSSMTSGRSASPIVGNDKLAFAPRPVHRLDKPTRGLVLVAKTPIALRQLSDALAKQPCVVQKSYTVLVHGRVHAADQGVLDDPFDGKPALTSYRILRRTDRYTLLHVRPQTGRYHQVRRHLRYSLGHVVVGDAKYYYGTTARSGSPTRKHNDRDGLFLCAHELVFPHPTTKRLVDVSLNQVPEKFRRLLEDDDDNPRSAAKGPSLSPRFQRYVEMVKQAHGADFATTDGVECAGEPAVDPSKLVRPNQGDSEWIDDW